MTGVARTKRLTALVGSIAAGSALAGLVCYLLGRAPEFYHRIERVSLEERQAESRQFVRRSAGVWNQMENEATWCGLFREAQVNAWLAGDFAHKHSEILPRGVSEPRVAFERGRVALAFRMKRGPLRLLVSLDGRMWLPAPNLIAIELDRVRAGSVPLPYALVLDTLSGTAERAGLAVEWKRHEGKPVALLRLANSDAEGLRVDRVELDEQVLYLAGRSKHYDDSDRPAAESASADSQRKVQLPDSPLRR